MTNDNTPSRLPLHAGELQPDEPFIIDWVDGSPLGVQRALREGKLTYRQAKKLWPQVKNV
jgi:hypothetical protein